MRYILLTIILFFVKITSFAQKLNFILIMVDDQGYGDYSFNGNPLIKTPNIDKWAINGIHLTDFHVSPMSTPTRGQLLTGLDAFRNGAMNVSSGRALLRPEIKTIANIFTEAGYQTGIFGKWHLGDTYPYRPEDRGFKEALWFPSSHINSIPDYWDNDYFDDILIHNTQKKKYTGYCTDVFFGEAIKWMDHVSSNGENFFTYIPLNSAHWPWFVPEKYRDVVRSYIAVNPDVTSHLPKQKLEDLTSFLAMGISIDENIGILNGFLEKKGLAENTVIVFLTDNGSTMGVDYYNAGMRGSKTTLWEGGHRVPCIIKAPRRIIKKPNVINELCHVQDLLPTLCSMAEIHNIPKNLDGINLYPLLRGDTSSLEDRMIVINYSRMPTFKVDFTTDNPAVPNKNGAAVLWKKWRFLENKSLYNVSKDPHQDKDVAEDYPEIVGKMRNHLYKWWDEVKDTALEIQKAPIGSSYENPVLLTACEWLDVFVDQQIQIRRGIRRNGVWHVYVEKEGEYEFELRRWPRESGYALRDSIPTLKVYDGEYVRGVSLPIRYGEIKIGNQRNKKKIRDNDKAVNFHFYLERGENTIQTWFKNDKGEEISGAYYLYTKLIQ